MHVLLPGGRPPQDGGEEEVRLGPGVPDLGGKPGPEPTLERPEEARLLIGTKDPAVTPTPLLAQWAPDGRKLYYKALDAEGRASFWSIPAEGGRPEAPRALR
jgi:hypothetical protein